MRNVSGIAGATLLYGPHEGAPDLCLVMQGLLDDLRGDGRRILGVKLAAGSLRLRTDPFEIVMTLAQGPLPLGALQGLLRPMRGDRPDFARVHLSRMLRLHCHAVGFLIRRRGAPTAPPDEAMRSLTREGQLSLLPVLRVAPPAVLIWQPGRLVLSAREFCTADSALLLSPGDAETPLNLTRLEREALLRPDAMGELPPTASRDITCAPGEAPRSVGHLFGAEPPIPHVTPISGIERASDRITAAMRGAAQEPLQGRRPRVVARLALAAMLPWLGWLSGVY